MTAPQAMWCNRCGETFRRSADALAHICSPNHTGLNPGEPVRVGGFEGVVSRVSRHDVAVYFRSNFRTQWFAAVDVERIT